MGLFRDGRSRSLVFALMCALGCGSSGGGGSGTGGSPGSGGATGTGGAIATGGSQGSGGSSGTGGASATGGSLGTGGGTGGAHATGGSTGTGGASATGGSLGTGGAAGKGVGGAGSGGHAGSAGGGGGHGGTSTGAGGAAGSSGGAGGDPLAGWTLTWSDEFNGADGSAVDASKWIHDVGGSGWGNSELEYYTNGTQNAVVQGGNLVITATTAGASSYNCSYPSSGTVQVHERAPAEHREVLADSTVASRRASRSPRGRASGRPSGCWAPTSTASTGRRAARSTSWRTSARSRRSIMAACTCRLSGSTTDSSLTGMYTLPGGAKLGDAFHTYAIEWSASAIKLLPRRHAVRDADAPDRDRADLGVRPAVLLHPERRRRRHLAGRTGLHDDLPADDEGRLGPRLPAREVMSAVPGRSRTRYYWFMFLRCTFAWVFVQSWQVVP